MYIEAKKSIKRNFLRLRDVTNIMRYGPKAPKYAELIWVRPQDIHHAVFSNSKFITTICSGCVTSINKFFIFKKFYNEPHINACIEHWVNGIPWEDTKDFITMLNAIKRGKFWVGCKTEVELRQRYLKLDQMFRQAKYSKRLKTRKELDPNTFREEGGILICIGENGEPLIFDGYHRLSISLILDLPIIPAQLGCVDISAIKSLEKYRIPPNSESIS